MSRVMKKKPADIAASASGSAAAPVPAATPVPPAAPAFSLPARVRVPNSDANVNQN